MVEPTNLLHRQIKRDLALIYKHVPRKQALFDDPKYLIKIQKIYKKNLQGGKRPYHYRYELGNALVMRHVLSKLTKEFRLSKPERALVNDALGRNAAQDSSQKLQMANSLEKLAGMGPRGQLVYAKAIDYLAALHKVIVLHSKDSQFQDMLSNPAQKPVFRHYQMDGDIAAIVKFLRKSALKR